jgi:hypothetical protein
VSSLQSFSALKNYRQRGLFEFYCHLKLIRPLNCLRASARDIQTNKGIMAEEEEERETERERGNTHDPTIIRHLIPKELKKETTNTNMCKTGQWTIVYGLWTLITPPYL